MSVETLARASRLLVGPVTTNEVKSEERRGTFQVFERLVRHMMRLKDGAASNGILISDSHSQFLNDESLKRFSNSSCVCVYTCQLCTEHMVQM